MLSITDSIRGAVGVVDAAGDVSMQRENIHGGETSEAGGGIRLLGRMRSERRDRHPKMRKDRIREVEHPKRQEEGFKEGGWN
jgi:hypothetical protein